MMTGIEIFWRFKDGGKEWCTGFVCEQQGTRIRIGSYREIASGMPGNVWVTEREIEWEKV